MENDMTREEYAEYEASVASFLKDFEGEPSSGYWSCPECDGELNDDQRCLNEDCHVGCTYEYNEPSFSWRSCDCCNSRLGGDREDVIGWLKGARASKYSEDYQWSGQVCIDCRYYFEYGRLDDTTMMEVEQDSGKVVGT